MPVYSLCLITILFLNQAYGADGPDKKKEQQSFCHVFDPDSIDPKGYQRPSDLLPIQPWKEGWEEVPVMPYHHLTGSGYNPEITQQRRKQIEELWLNIGRMFRGPLLEMKTSQVLRPIDMVGSWNKIIIVYSIFDLPALSPNGFDPISKDFWVQFFNRTPYNTDLFYDIAIAYGQQVFYQALRSHLPVYDEWVQKRDLVIGPLSTISRVRHIHFLEHLHVGPITRMPEDESDPEAEQNPLFRSVLAYPWGSLTKDYAIAFGALFAAIAVHNSWRDLPKHLEIRNSIKGFEKYFLTPIQLEDDIPTDIPRRPFAWEPDSRDQLMAHLSDPKHTFLKHVLAQLWFKKMEGESLRVMMSHLVRFFLASVEEIKHRRATEEELVRDTHMNYGMQQRLFYPRQ